MEISGQLLKPFIEKMENEWDVLYREVCGYQEADVGAMRSMIEQRMRQLEKFRMSAVYFDQDREAIREFPDLREALRLLKLDLRATRRMWRRQLVTKIRTQQRKERLSHETTFVA